MKKTDLLIIGGSAGGMLAAGSARQAYGDFDITMIRETEQVLVPCGIPYIFGDLGSTDKDVVPDTNMKNAGVHIVVDTAVEIDRKNKIVKLKKGEDCQYKKLIIATGSSPIIPTFIPGYDLENVFAIIKDKKYFLILQSFFRSL